MPGDPFYKSALWVRKIRPQVIARSGGRCEVPGCPNAGKVVEHRISRRDGGPDTVANCWHLCRDHDNQIKESASGARRSGGTLTVKGCDADGWPLDPARR